MHYIQTNFYVLATFAVVSIDCGSSDSYTDENSIKWVGDDDFVQNGKSQVVQTTNGVSHVMGTLRVFSTRKKNCYSIKAEKGSQFLVRASFYYGNYDKKSAPPSFDLQLDGNYWNTIQTSAEGVVYDEVIYITKGDSIELCLAQTQPNQLPFISAIEIRGLASEMYNHVDSEYAMLLTRRVAYGATEAIRYIYAMLLTYFLFAFLERVYYQSVTFLFPSFCFA